MKSFEDVLTNIAEVKINASLPDLPPERPNRPIPSDFTKKGFKKDSPEYIKAMQEAQQKFEQETKEYDKKANLYDSHRKAMEIILEETKHNKDEKEIRRILSNSGIASNIIDETFSIYHLYKDFDLCKQRLDNCFIYCNGKPPVGEDYPPLYERLILTPEQAKQIETNLNKVIYFFPSNFPDVLQLIFLSQSAKNFSEKGLESKEGRQKDNYDTVTKTFAEHEDQFHIMQDLQALIKGIQQWAGDPSIALSLDQKRSFVSDKEKPASKSPDQIQDELQKMKSRFMELQKIQNGIMETPEFKEKMQLLEEQKQLLEEKNQVQKYIETVKPSYMKEIGSGPINPDVAAIFDSTTFDELKNSYKTLSDKQPKKQGFLSIFSSQPPEDKLLKNLEKEWPQIKEPLEVKVERKKSH